MTFDELLNLVSSKDAQNRPRLCSDSRLVQKGDIFIALKGTACDGHDFIDQAIKNGAKYIVSQKNITSHELVTVDNSAIAAATLAQVSAGYPASKLTNLAVTGTNGKTTVAFLVRSCIQTANEKCGLIGTVFYDTGRQSCDADLTTPDCLAIAQMQEQMLKAGAKYMVIEASSHALDQNRLANIDFKAAAFTNLAGDHLDYHKTKTDYLAAKTKLFQTLSPDATAVLNKQSKEAKLIAEKTNAKILWYAVDSPADLTAHIESMNITGTTFTIETRATNNKPRATIKTPLLGRYNISNHLAAAGLCLAAGLDLKTTAKGLTALKTIPGRLEKLDWGGDFSVIIDYAHTDDALKNVLETLKPLCTAKLIVVFGCGGDRDRTKRPRMAKVAEQLADFIVVTTDNPRTEQTKDRITEIVAGFENPNSPNIKIEPDRKKAIHLALNSANKGDIVLIAGKGHETYQLIGTKKFDFCDKKVAEEYLTKRK
ncbi:MAG: UDP-N-acetylmuramoyl-L-alanyl-D-glutamate--2,6-diaminopimelate ligase [Planctomycetota bacterium]|nr:MAG: UDP-N-acetylmuramoyl-L-alanyl-D-glutamate--2,6-diaminopimelate ligase [Planctomycetota bacterium]